MDEYDKLYTYLESGTYLEGLSKDGNIIIIIMTWVDFYNYLANEAYGELLPFADEWSSIVAINLHERNSMRLWRKSKQKLK